ncbi:MAG: D-aminoacyl-tRNA deacylase [Thermodesulfobacteriota bacterium]
MRAIIQRVKEGRVRVEQEIVGQIGPGLLIFLGVTGSDSESDVRFMVEKIANLRIFADQDDKMNLSLRQTGGEALVVSQFTLYGDCRKGRRPSFGAAAPPNQAEELYELFCDQLAELVRVSRGRFQAMMEVELINDGPVTFIVESAK